MADLVSTDGTITKPNKGAFVFQDSALLPWLTVQNNVELLMKLEGLSNIKEKTSIALEQVGLTGFEKNYPHQLSGGMKMRLSPSKKFSIRPRIHIAR